MEVRVGCDENGSRRDAGLRVGEIKSRRAIRGSVIAAGEAAGAYDKVRGIGCGDGVADRYGRGVLRVDASASGVPHLINGAVLDDQRIERLVRPNPVFVAVPDHGVANG